MLLPQLLEDFFQKVLVGFGEYEMGLKKKSFACKCCGNDTEFVWKTRHGKATTILTWFRWITLQAITGAVQAVWQQAIYHPDVARHGAEEEGS